MIIKETEQKEVEVIKSILCDSCGAECIKSLGAEYMSLEVNWGFTSGHDLETWTAQLCEKCVDDKLSFINFQKGKY